MMDLYKNYKEKYDNSAASIETYRKVFVGENIVFLQPSADDCETCLEYNVHIQGYAHN